MKGIKDRKKKGILLTLLMLIIFILMISELVSYVLTNISYNEIATRTSIAINTGAFSTSLTSGIASDMQYSLYNAMQDLYEKGVPLSYSPYGTNVASKYLYSMVENGTADGATYNSLVNSSLLYYVPAMEKHASVLGFSLKILNPSLRVYENGTWSISAEYTALAIINSSSGTFTYPVDAVATVPLSGIKAEYVMPLTFTNYQDVATPKPFQQMLQINSSKYSSMEASNLDNVEFIYSNGTVIPSWLESGASNTSSDSVYWLKLNGISANGYSEVYMVFANPSRNMFNGVITGEAPNLSSTYAEYDDGSSVFNFYDNFAGTSVSPEWVQSVPSGTTITQDNGVTITTSSSSSYGGLILSKGFTGIQIFEGHITSVSGVAAGLALQNGNTSSSGGIDFNYWGGSVATGTMSGGMTNNNNPNLQVSTGIMGGAWTGSSSQVWYKNYQSYSGTQNAYSLPSTVYPSIGIYQSSPSTSISFQWVRTRAYPPNGVMPAVSIGSPSLYVS